MKHSELRRGNWVKVRSGEEVQIKCVSIQSEPAGAWPTVHIDYYAAYADSLNPIPITEEWLRKLGFTLKEEWPSGSGANFFRPDRKVTIGISHRYGNTIKITNGSRDENWYMIDYVHELQNIYHYLTGEII